MTTLQIELPDYTANAARAAGLLTSQSLERLLTDALRKHNAAAALLQVAGQVAQAGVAPMSTQDIKAEIAASRCDANRAFAAKISLI